MSSTIFCPFADDGICRGDCPSNRERACINDEED